MSQATSGRAEGMERGNVCEMREEGRYETSEAEEWEGEGKGGLQEGMD